MVNKLFDVNWKNAVEFSPENAEHKKFSSSFYRGEHCNFNPYKQDLQQPDFIVDYFLKGFIEHDLRINKDSRITAFGSCFAQHITNHLHAKGFSLLNKKESAIYISEFGEGLVNTNTIRQQFEWSLENKQFNERLWFNKKKGFHPYSAELAKKTREVFEQTEIFIITLGLSEIWYDRESGDAFWSAVPRDMFDPQRHLFKNQTLSEILDDLSAINTLIREHCNQARIIFTVSPIPLAATFRPANCIFANSVSKAKILSALDEFFQLHASEFNQRLFYFPSYQIVEELFKDRFCDDRRHPRDAVIRFVLEVFDDFFVTGEGKNKDKDYRERYDIASSEA